MSCPWCSGGCTGADLDPLLIPELSWLWRQLADRADRRSDPALTTGTVAVRVPASVPERQAAVGLLGGRALRPGQTSRVDLATLTGRLVGRGAGLTPGTVAAHAVRRRLGTRQELRSNREQQEGRLQAELTARLADLPDRLTARIGSQPWPRLRLAGLVTRLLHQPDPTAVLQRAVDVIAQLPLDADRIDRRRLVPGDPHALDAGLLPSLVRTLMQAPPGRSGWAGLGVDVDDLVGGLLALGLAPVGWSLPPGSVATIPPRELDRVSWPEPGPDESWVFVTENPSVVAAAVPYAVPPAARPRIRLLCTVGTPSDLEADAIGRLPAAGWQVAVRADFDPAGLAHVRTLLAACPPAVPWRMAAADYRSSPVTGTGLVVAASETPWDPGLAAAITERGGPAYEESLVEALIDDLRHGRPAGAPHQG